jgi:hypothetical protein
MEPIALVELGLHFLEFGLLTVRELKNALEYKRKVQKQEAVQRAEMLVILVNACGCNLKKKISVQDLLGFNPYEKAECKKTKTDAEDDLHYLKQRLGG